MALQKNDKFSNLKILHGSDIHMKYQSLGGYGIFLGRESPETIEKELVVQKQLANWIAVIERGLVPGRIYELGKYYDVTNGQHCFVTSQGNETEGYLANYIGEYDRKQIINQIEEYERNGKHTKG
jgi:hypothetical protein